MHNPYCQELHQKGYTVISEAYDVDFVNSLKAKLLTEWEKASANPLPDYMTPGLNKGHQMIYNLQNKDVSFFQAFTRHPLLRAILIQCLNDEWYKQIPQENPNYILRSLLARSSGKSSMPLHIDSFIPNPGSHIPLLQVAIVLEKQTLENGCTLVIPGSHQFGRYAAQDWKQYAVPVESNAGDIVIWDSRLWHSAGENKTSDSRWSIVGTFSRWWIKQNYNITGKFPKEFLAELTNEEKSILGFCSMPPEDEFDRQDIKAGYEIL